MRFVTLGAGLLSALTFLPAHATNPIPAPGAGQSARQLPRMPRATAMPRPGYVRIQFSDKLGGVFETRKLTVYLDGRPVYTRASTNEPIELPIGYTLHRDQLAPALHRVSVAIEANGRGYGVFSYVQGYKLVAKSGSTFQTHPDTVTTIHVVAKEKLAGSVEKQLSIAFDVKKAHVKETAFAARL